ncbi:hypothetical protein HMN09_00670100 [Mycena chlorophos]|uniref:Uncharacterized protein n=1 Tax=Mycena chlorophos TaxID=658473 RepID=A0A8H6W812_MYCCL|nr:hypothetical protein HMN09_00670100 [Mycena chlorophos]
MFCNFQAGIGPAELALSRSVGITRFLFPPPHHPRKFSRTWRRLRRQLSHVSLATSLLSPVSRSKFRTPFFLAYSTAQRECSALRRSHRISARPKTILRYALANDADLVSAAELNAERNAPTWRNYATGLVLYNPSLSFGLLPWTPLFSLSPFVRTHCLRAHRYQNPTRRQAQDAAWTPRNAYPPPIMLPASSFYIEVCFSCG